MLYRPSVTMLINDNDYKTVINNYCLSTKVKRTYLLALNIPHCQIMSSCELCMYVIIVMGPFVLITQSEVAIYPSCVDVANVNNFTTIFHACLSRKVPCACRVQS